MLSASCVAPTFASHHRGIIVGTQAAKGKTTASNPGRNGGSLNRYPKGQTGNAKGRPPRIITKTVRDFVDEGIPRVTATDVAAAMEGFLNMTTKQISELANDGEQPIFIRVICRNLLLLGKISEDGVKLDPRDGYQVIMDILDRAHGKARQSVDVKQTGERPHPQVIERVIYKVQE